MLPGFGEVRIAVIEQPDASPPTAEIVLQGTDGQPIYRFPPLPGSDSWAYVGTDGLRLADIDGDGQQDLVAVVEMATGIGPGGAEPFKAGAVYLRRANGFEADRKLDEKLNEPPLRDQWSDAATLAEVAGKIAAPGR